jgi:hypothetical protein
MRTVTIKTTAYSEEDLVILTDITKNEIEGFLSPLVLEDREHDEKNGEFLYDNSDFVNKLMERFPNHKVYVVGMDDEIIKL